MAIDIITGFNSSSRELLDKRSGPYDSTVLALSALDTNSRSLGMPIYIITGGTKDGAGNYTGGTVEVYNFDGGIADVDLKIGSAGALLGYRETGTPGSDLFIEIGAAGGINSLYIDEAEGEVNVQAGAASLYLWKGGGLNDANVALSVGTSTINLDETNGIEILGQSIKYFTGNLPSVPSAIYTERTEPVDSTGYFIGDFKNLFKTAVGATGSTWYGEYLKLNNTSATAENGSTGHVIDIRNQGTGDAVFQYASDITSRHSGSGDIGFLNGQVVRVLIDGTSASSVSTIMRGISPNVSMNNPNATVATMQGIHPTVDIQNGTLAQAQVIFLDFDVSVNATITGNLSYIEANGDALSGITVGGNKRFIRYTGTEQSDFGGLVNVTSALTVLEAAVDDKFLITKEYGDKYYIGSDLLLTSSTISSSRDSLLTDADGLNNSIAGSDVTITIVNNATVNLPIGTLLTYKRSGVGNVIIAGGAGVTMPSYQTYQLDDLITVRQVSIDTWEFLNPPLNLSGATGENRTPVIVATATYTLLEADILANKIFLFTNNVASEIIVTMPAITKVNTDIVEVKMRSVNGIPISITPDVGVSQIIFTPRIVDEVFSIVSTDDDIWMKWNNTNSEIINIPVTGVTVTPATASVPAGDPQQLTATIAPANATDQTGTWSSDSASATVDIDGLVTTVSPGVANITFTTNDGAFTDSSAITVTAVAATNIILNSTFDDASNLTLGNGWSVVTGELFFNDGFDNALVTFATSEDIVDTGNYDLDFDILNGGTNRFAVLVNGVEVVAATNYPTALGQTVNFTFSGVAISSIVLRANNSAGATAFYMDNVTLTKTN